MRRWGNVGAKLGVFGARVLRNLREGGMRRILHHGLRVHLWLRWSLQAADFQNKAVGVWLQAYGEVGTVLGFKFDPAYARDCLPDLDAAQQSIIDGVILAGQLLHQSGVVEIDKNPVGRREAMDLVGHLILQVDNDSAGFGVGPVA